MSSQVTVIVGSGGCCLPTYPTDIGLLPRVDLEMVRQVVTPGKFLVTVDTLIVPGPSVLRHVSLPVALHCELQTALVAHEGFHPSVGPHVLLQQGLPQVGLLAEIAFERSLPLVFVLPHVVHQIALSHKLFLADVTGVRFLAVVLDPYVLVYGCLVEDLHTHWTLSIQTRLLPGRHKAAFVFPPYVSGQGRTVDEHLKTEVTLLWLLVVFTLLVPIQVSLGFKYFATVAE